MKDFNLKLLAEILNVHSVPHATLNSKKTEFKITYRESSSVNSSWFVVSVDELIPMLKAYITKTRNTLHSGKCEYGYSGMLNVVQVPSDTTHCVAHYHKLFTARTEASMLYLVCNYIYTDINNVQK